MPLKVKAWRKTGKPSMYPTRILRHLRDFEPGTPPKLSPYGGLMGRKLKATGFFHARKLGDRWWLVDPQGFRFLHVAVNGVRHGTSPQPQRAFPAKFGTVEKWRDATLALLADHGFNGTACWSDDDILHGAKRRLTHCPQWNFMSSYGRKRGGVYQKPGHTGYPSSCIFVFDPESKTADPSNLDSNKGIVRTNYEPYTPLLDAMKELNSVVYPLVHYFDQRK